MSKIRNKQAKLCIMSDASNAHTVKWARYFSNHDFDTYVISPTHAMIEGVHVITFKNNARISFLYKLKRLLWFRNALKKIKPDIVHIHFMPTNIGALIKFFMVKNMVISTWGKDIVYDGLFPEPKRQILVKKFLLRWAREVTATSNFQALITRKYMPKNKDVHVIPFGVDCEIFDPLLKKNVSKKNKHIQLGFIKHLLPKYGPEYLIEAMPQILQRYPNTKLIMVGDGHLRDQLENMCIQLGIKDHVKFTGKIHPDEVPKLLAEIDILVMPSVYDSETFGVAAVEASAMEIPVVASRVGGVLEVVINGVTGILVPPRNHIEIAKAIIKLISDPGLRLIMGKKGREVVLKKYNLNKCGKTMSELYKNILEKERKRKMEIS